MSETTTTEVAAETPAEATPVAPAGNYEALVSKLRDVGIAWASVGVCSGKAALESTAKALAETAKSLEEIGNKLKAS